jgi:undecaprenyl-diphosphatase
MSRRDAVTVSVVLFGVFLVLAGLVIVDRDLVVDRSLLEWIADERTSGLNSVFRLVTHLGSGWVLYPLTAVAAGLLWRRDGDFRRGALLAASLLGATVLYGVTKAIIERPRPPAAEAVGTFTNWSFPSGHATQSIACYGMLAFLITGGNLRPRWPWMAAGVLTLVAGVSRIYLGAHWLTDVLGGWALGGSWWMLVTAAGLTVGWVRARVLR